MILNKNEKYQYLKKQYLLNMNNHFFTGCEAPKLGNMNN